MTGGYNAEAQQSAELLRGDGLPWRGLPPLPRPRYWHSQTGLETCGGWDNTTSTQCVMLSSGNTGTIVLSYSHTYTFNYLSDWQFGQQRSIKPTINEDICEEAPSFW